MTTTETHHLLRRPRSMPTLEDVPPGLNAEYTAKFVYFKSRTDILPRVCYNSVIQIMYSHLIIKSSWPPVKLTIPLVSIGYIETEPKYDRFDIRGHTFQLHLVGFRNVLQPVSTLEESRDRLRFLVVRQRIPHRIMKLPLDWEVSNTEKKDNKCFMRKLSIKRIKKSMKNLNCIKNNTDEAATCSSEL
uniref:SPATA6 domain-containing protein n=1 Tax=Panagrellus redivivus TaxID=6233 RepID=A0A7E5A012_PANRE